MGQEGTGLSGLVPAGVSSARLEMVVVVVAVVLVVALLAVRAWYSRDHRHRKASSGGYHQRDLARYSPEGFELSDGDTADPRGRPLAPTFVSPMPSGRIGGKRGGRRRVPTSPSAAMGGLQVRPQVAYGTYDPSTHMPPRPFDAAEAERLRPPEPLPFAVLPGMVDVRTDSLAEEAFPQDVPVLEDEPGPEVIPPPAGALPLLMAPPPPPADPATPPSSV